MNCPEPVLSVLLSYRQYLSKAANQNASGYHTRVYYLSAESPRQDPVMRSKGEKTRLSQEELLLSTISQPVCYDGFYDKWKYSDATGRGEQAT